jgi:hypothetical protein
MLEKILLLAAILVFAFACRTFANRYIAKCGWIALLVATYIAGFWLSGGSNVAGGLSVGLWFVLPWLEIVGRVRKLRFPAMSEVKHRFPPNREIFPDLPELSSEAEGAGFVETDNAGWRWDEAEHFVRLFYNAESRTQAAITLAQQDEYSISYVSITSRTPDGCTYSTSNYPFSYSMKFTPTHHLNRYEEAQSFEDLLDSHTEFLFMHALEPDDLAEMNAEELPVFIQTDMRQQIDHNVRVGLLEPVGEGLFRYTWRGCFFLWGQVLKDMIRV